MKQKEPEFWVLEYITITKDPRTGLVVAIGGSEKAAYILQRTGGFLSAPGPSGDYHRLPHGLPVEHQRLKATAASHALLAAGHSVHLDPALNALVTPDSEHNAALRFLTQLAKRASAAKTSSAVAEVLTEIVAPANGLLPLTREVVVRAWIAASALHRTAPGEEPEPLARLRDTANSMSQAACVILHARNDAARAPQPAALTPPPSSAHPSASRRR
ncbi:MULTISPECIES: hypothetical protein [Streptomyces]|jgi:hypothetical protein|uniref:Uncharacterized protein n=1 Tax=Streptomyces achromogenes TaxID=67255 RepID=A0ABU0Q9V6_STRAH|nr:MULTISPECIES: hypothetical protein [Streptomyces]MDQ0687136.1 hypothetical protein [Streptomyces achromogenes]MDX3119693.1 hypothetical protein [Streptomyces scabiei]MDX3248568.1 hypothetical protein [Streptomyces sp. ME18-1-4]